MGTNYYCYDVPCGHCGRTGERKHIGESSGGWCFSLRVYPHDEKPIRNLDDWRSFLVGKVIEDEYGGVITLDDMLKIITERSWYGDRAYRGYDGPVDFFRRNGCHDGPNSLLRRNIDGRRCVGHGEGTWDYVVGEFS